MNITKSRLIPEIRHNAIGQVISKINADNKVTTYSYDAVGNLLSTTDACGKTVATTYDGNYQKLSVTDANGNKTEYSYNGNMKNTKITLPDAHTICNSDPHSYGRRHQSKGNARFHRPIPDRKCPHTDMAFLFR